MSIEGRWICTEGGSNKFYEVKRLRPDTYVVAWGANDKPIFNTKVVNQEYVDVKLKDLNRKKYEKIDGNTRTDIIIDRFVTDTASSTEVGKHQELFNYLTNNEGLDYNSSSGKSEVPKAHLDFLYI